jgi:RNA polymerase sigma-70 factor (ECF subfamily)
LTLAPALSSAAPAATAEVDLARLRRRDAAAWSALFERDFAIVYRATFARVGDREAAEDIAAQAFLEAMEGIGRYRDRGKPITAWLLAIARHRAMDWFRRRVRDRATGDPVEPATDGPEASLTVALDALALLTPDQREVVHLRFVEGYSLEEVAGMTGRRVGAVKSLQHRGLERLRRLLLEVERC